MFNSKKTVWINGGDSSFPIKVKKGTRVLMSGGSFYVVGKKDDSERYFSIKEKKFMLQVYGCFTTIHLVHNLDLKTKFELLKSGIRIDNSIPFNLDLECDENCAHVYNSYEQYVRVIKYFAPNISEEQLEQGIYQITKDGQVISLDKMCFNIISNNRNLGEQDRVKKLVPKI